MNALPLPAEQPEPFDLLQGQAAAPAAPTLAFQSESRGLSVYHGNSLTLLDELLEANPEGLFDMIFADPPYFLSGGGTTCQAGCRVKVDKGDWDKPTGPELMHAFNLAWLERCQRALKPNGTIWVTGTHHVIFSVGYAMQQLGLKVLNDIAWEKPNPPPNLACRRFTHSTETVLWASKNADSKHCFNYQAMKQVTGKQMKTVWTMAAPGASEKHAGRHTTQKPLALVERCILASTEPGALVFDPFLGSGTTLVAAANTGRRGLGCELEATYSELAARRLQALAAA